MTSSNIRVSDVLVIEKVCPHAGVGMEKGYIFILVFSFQNQRVPADIVLLRTTEKSGKTIKVYLWAKAHTINGLHHRSYYYYGSHGNSILGSCFVRTDQLDGETDWKLKVAVPSCQALATNEVCLYILRIA